MEYRNKIYVSHLDINWWKIQQNMPGRFLEIPVFLGDCFYAAPCRPSIELYMYDVGDPTTFGNLPLDELIEDAVVESLKSKKRNGYAPSVGQQ